MILDWADGGNLHDFWQAYGDLDALPHDQRLAIWTMKQILGLAKGLQAIQRCEIKSDGIERLSTADSIHVEDSRQHGAHGDIKPENILWFKNHGDTLDGCPLGHMKLSDFGMTSFHKTNSRTSFAARGWSPTHRAPEIDIHNNTIGQKYDIWTFGAVLFEFTTWYLLGWNGFKRFERERMQHPPWSYNIHEDAFYTVCAFDEQRQPSEAKKNEAVKRVSPIQPMTPVQSSKLTWNSISKNFRNV